MNPEDIKSVSPGDLLSAQRDEQILQALRRKLTAPDFIQDPTGCHLLDQPNRRIIRFEMPGELLLPQTGYAMGEAVILHAVGGSGTPYLSEIGGEGPIKLVDSMRMHSKMATEGDDVGAYGLAWIADDPPVKPPYEALWEIITMQTPGPFYGILQTPLSRKAGGGESTATVEVFDVKGGGHRTLWGYDVFGPGWSAAYGGPYITVYNPPRENSETTTPPDNPGLFWFDAKIGTCVFCMWHMRDNRYYVVNQVANLTVSGADAGSISAISNPCWGIAFSTTDFIVVTDGEGEVSVSLR